MNASANAQKEDEDAAHLATAGLGYKLSRVAQIFQRAGDKLLSPYQLDRLSWTVLSSIGHSEIRTPGTIAHFTAIERTVTSRLLTQLERKGFVQSTRTEIDGRSRTFSLTKLGQRTCAELPAKINQMHLELSSALTEQDRETLHRLLDVLGEKNGDVWQL